MRRSDEMEVLEDMGKTVDEKTKKLLTPMIADKE